jgi:hypothetical protein
MAKKQTIEELRAERGELIAKLKAEREAELATHAEIERQIRELEARRAKKKAELEGLARNSNADLGELDRKIAAAVAEEQIDLLHATARQLDVDGHSAERLARFEKLAAELHTAKRLAPNHELRSLNIKRMRRMEGATMWSPPYASWQAMAQAWVR